MVWSNRSIPIGEQGYKGSKTPIIEYVTKLRQQLAASEPDGKPVGRTQPSPLSEHLYRPRQLTRWFVGKAENLRLSQKTKLDKLCQNITDLALTYQLVQEWRELFKERRAEGLKAWLTRAEQSGVSELISFARGIRRDEAAVRASLELKWSQGPVEGEVNKLKLIKRSMYNRAKFELLRIRVLAA